MRFIPLGLVVISLLVGLFFCAITSAAADSASTVITKTIASGVTLTQEFTANPPLIIDVVTADLSVRGVRVETAIGGDSITAGTGDVDHGTEQVEALAARHGAVAAINGDFFSAGDPLGFGVNDGEIYSEPWKIDRSALGIEPDGHTVVFGRLAFSGKVTASDGTEFNLTAINRPVARADTNDLVAFTQLYGPVAGSRPGCTEVVLSGVNLPLSPNKLITGTVATVTPGIISASTIPDDGLVLSSQGAGPASDFLIGHLRVGSVVSLTAAVAPRADLPGAVKIALLPRGDDGNLPSRGDDGLDRVAGLWSAVDQAIGGGPRLITDGQITIDGVDEGFDSSFTDGPNPRTAVGVTRDGKLLMFTVDGRGELSQGVSLHDLAAIMLHHGVVDGINLDGGGSTAMACGGVTVDYPAEPGAGRHVADMLAVYAPSNRQPTPLTAAIDEIPLAKVGTAVKLTATVDGKPLDGSDSRVIWRGVIDGGVGFVSQNGTLYARTPGTGTVIAVVDGMRVRRDVTVVGPDVSPASFSLTARLDPVPGNPTESRLSARLADDTGIPGAGMRITVKVSGGAVDKLTDWTDEDGVARFLITWTESTGSVTVTSRLQPPIKLNYDAQAEPANTTASPPPVPPGQAAQPSAPTN